MEPGAIQIALALFDRPALASTLRRSPIPRDIVDVLRIAAADPAARDEIALPPGIARKQLREAAIFYLQQILLHADAEPYRILGCEAGAPLRVRREHMRWLMRWLHPDHNKDAFENQLAARVLSAWNRTKDEKGDDRAFPVVGVGAAPHLHALNFEAEEPHPEVLRARANRNMRWRGATAVGVAICVFALLKLTTNDNGVEARHAALLAGLSETKGETALEAAEVPTAVEGPLAERSLAEGGVAPSAQIESAPAPDDGTAMAAASLADEAQVTAPEGIAAAPEPSPRPLTPASASPPPEDIAASDEDGPSPALARAENLTPDAEPETLPPARGGTALNRASADGSDRKTDAVDLSASLASFVSSSADDSAPNQPAPSIPELTADRADELVTSFLAIYESGDLEALLALFSADATNNRGGRNAIIEDYAQLFADTTARRLVITNLDWTRSGSDLTGAGRFAALVQRTNRRREREVTGDIEIRVTRDDDRILIRQIRHKNDLL